MSSSSFNRTGWVSRRWTPYIALALSLLFTILVTAYLLWAASVRDQARFESVSAEIEANIQNLLNTYVALLQAGEGFVEVNEGGLTRQRFRAFANALELTENYPGVQGIGYSKRIANETISSVEADIRQNGVADFHVWPTEDGEYSHAILFLEPLDRRNLAAIGYNMHSEPVRRAAMDKARDTGLPVLSGRVTLVQEIDEKKQAGFLIYNPIYKGKPETLTERREQLLGFVYSPFRADDFFRLAHERDLINQFDFSVYAGEIPAQENLLHDSAAFQTGLPDDFQPRFSGKTTKEVAGNVWTLVFRSRPGFENSLSRNFVWGGFAVGTVFSLLIFLIARSQSRGWQKAEQWADRLAESQQELEVSEARLRLHVEELQLAEKRITAAAERSQILAQASNAFAEAALDSRAVSQVATDAVVSHLGDFSGVALLTEDGEHLTLAAFSHRDPARADAIMQFLEEGPVPIKGAIFERVVLEKRTVFLPFATREALEDAVPAEQYGFIQHVSFSSVIALPLAVQGRVVGAIGAARHRESTPYTEEDYFILNELASRVALAVENASLYERAQKAIHLRDEFLSIASHELKTPLTPLQLQVQSLQRMLNRSVTEPMNPERLRKIAEVTQRQVERLTSLVNNLLDISRISAGKLEFEPEAFDLTALVKDVVERFQIESERLNVPIHIAAPEPVTGCWDRLRLEQVVTNLVSNALKYGAGQPVEVSVGMKDSRAELVVADRGIGLDPEFRNRLFQRFARGVSGRDISGLGLGLYIVKQIVDGHQGQIDVESEPERGARFTVRLPLRPSPRQAGSS